MDPTSGSGNTANLDPHATRSRLALDREERLIKDGILRMGSLVEAQIRGGVAGLMERDLSRAEAIIAGDAAVNDAQREVTDLIASTIATQSPVARDLRFLLALNHVSFELERMGDHASSIAKQTRWLVGQPTSRIGSGIGSMGHIAADLVDGILQALVNVDDALARSVAARDDEIDHGYRTLFAEVVEAMRQDPGLIEGGTRLILAGHWIERIGDRVTNIAEDIVYLSIGRVEDLNQ
ncbi:MAG: phosphate signaling complex protein PhoU [Chloroflexota bacterium]